MLAFSGMIDFREIEFLQPFSTRYMPNLNSLLTSDFNTEKLWNCHKVS